MEVQPFTHWTPPKPYTVANSFMLAMYLLPEAKKTYNLQFKSKIANIEIKICPCTRMTTAEILRLKCSTEGLEEDANPNMQKGIQVPSPGLPHQETRKSLQINQALKMDVLQIKKWKNKCPLLDRGFPGAPQGLYLVQAGLDLSTLMLQPPASTMLGFLESHNWVSPSDSWCSIGIASGFREGIVFKWLNL